MNHNIYDPSAHRIVTAARFTTNCLARAVKVIHEGIDRGVACRDPRPRGTSALVRRLNQRHPAEHRGRALDHGGERHAGEGQGPVPAWRCGCAVRGDRCPVCTPACYDGRWRLPDRRARPLWRVAHSLFQGGDRGHRLCVPAGPVLTPRPGSLIGSRGSSTDWRISFGHRSAA